MRKVIALSAVALTGTTFLVSGAMGLPRDPADIGPALKVTIIPWMSPTMS